MTPDEIEKVAIEAGMLAFCDCYPENNLIKRLTAFTRAYERAMWRSAKSIPKDGTMHLLSDGVDVWIGSERDSDKSHMGMPVDGHELHSGPKGWQQRATHFRPLPKPEGV